MEFDNPEPSETILPLGREIYITPEQLSIKAIVDNIDRRVFKSWETTESE